MPFPELVIRIGWIVALVVAIYVVRRYLPLKFRIRPKLRLKIWRRRGRRKGKR